MDIDECLKKVGGYRRYSLAAMFVMGGSAMFTITSQLLLFVFVGMWNLCITTIEWRGLSRQVLFSIMSQILLALPS